VSWTIEMTGPAGELDPADPEYVVVSHSGQDGSIPCSREELGDLVAVVQAYLREPRPWKQQS